MAISLYGGAEGVRDRGILESALARPHSGYGGHRPFATPFHRAAALWVALSMNHGFVDGNKRTAVMAAAFQLRQEGFRVSVPDEELVAAALQVVDHRMDVAELGAWLEANSIQIGSTAAFEAEPDLDL